MKREAIFTTKFKKWVKLHTTVPSACAYEVKVTPNKRIPFSVLKQHQIDALLAVAHGTFVYKIPDAGWQNPFDMLTLGCQPAYVVLAFTEPRKKSHTYIVHIDVFLEIQRDMEEVGVKSVSRDTLDKYSLRFPETCQYHLI